MEKCRFLNGYEGSCRYGDKCRYSHDAEICQYYQDNFLTEDGRYYYNDDRIHFVGNKLEIKDLPGSIIQIFNYLTKDFDSSYCPDDISFEYESYINKNHTYFNIKSLDISENKFNYGIKFNEDCRYFFYIEELNKVIEQ
jgi:hypothetical protein